jgi:hypothetical protein
LSYTSLFTLKRVCQLSTIHEILFVDNNVRFGDIEAVAGEVCEWANVEDEETNYVWYDSRRTVDREGQ